MENRSAQRTNELDSVIRATLQSLTIASVWLVLFSVCYFVWQLPAWLGVSSLLVLLASLIGVWLPNVHTKKRFSFKFSFTKDPFFLSAIVIDLISLFLIWHARTDVAIVSPFHVLHPFIFVLYAIGSFFFLLALSQATRGRTYFLLVVHTLLTYGVSMIVYKVGFGYDPFVHEATMRYIADHGAIFPKQPYYLGEYVAIVSVHQLTGCSIAFLQTVLVPLLSVLLLPWLLLLGFDKMDTTKNSYFPLGSIFFLFGAYLAFTIPFNFAFLLFLFVLVLLPIENQWATGARLSLACATLVVHPLLGIPALALAIGRECKRSFGFFVSLTLVFVGIVGSFVFESVRVGAHVLPWSMETLLNAWHVLSTPAVDFFHAPFPWNILYGFAYTWPIVLIFIGCIGFYFSRHAHKQMIATIFGTATGMFLAVFFLSAFIRLPGIIAREQYEFALRLWNTIPWLFLFVISSFTAHCEVWFCNKPMRKILLVFVCTILMTGNWYVTYPQRNVAMEDYAPGVGKMDVAIVDAIEGNSKGIPYTVLSPQMVSAAALRRFGFEREVKFDGRSVYPFAIPTGDVLYAQYLDLLHGQSPTHVRDLFSHLNVNRLYVVLPMNQDPNATIEKTMLSVADASFSQDGFTVFLFDRK